MLTNRIFTVHIYDNKSTPRRLNNGLSQGSVLAPIIFNLYTSDIPCKASRTFIYADNVIVVSQRDKLLRKLNQSC